MPNDFGPIYIETDMSRFPVEPFNTFSNLIFLAIFFYWLVRLWGNFRQHKLLTICLPILFVGYIGGTVYHATRSHNVWLFMDFMPIFTLAFIVAYFYWYKLLHNHLRILLYVFLPFVLTRTAIRALPYGRHLTISFGYALLGCFLVIPMSAYAIKYKSPHSRYLVFAITIFGIAILFRVADFEAAETVKSILPMGTHWLWHLFGGIAAFLAIKFVYEDGESRSHLSIAAVNSERRSFDGSI
jgi:hemolysin III